MTDTTNYELVALIGKLKQILPEITDVSFLYATADQETVEILNELRDINISDILFSTWVTSNLSSTQSIPELLVTIGMSKSTYVRRCAAPEQFTLQELDAITEYLHINLAEAVSELTDLCLTFNSGK